LNHGGLSLPSLLETTVNKIGALDEEVIQSIRQHHNNLTKPPGSLGVLEDIAAQIGGITGEKFPDVAKKAVVVMAADHGVAVAGVSAYPPEVTPQMVLNFAHGGAAINVLARHAGANVIVVDVGVAANVDHPQVLSRKIRPGTANMADGPALTQDEAIRAIETGIEIAEDLIKQGYQCLATGEMGIGNTTAASAIMAAFLEIPVSEVTGRGTGLDDQAMVRKIQVIEKALAINQPNHEEPLDVLAKVGGLEIAALAGLILGCAAHRTPIVIDGFISSAAALAAGKIAPKSLNFMIASHCSAEMAHRKLLNYLKLKPILELEMRLGEGTGAVLAFHLIEAALKIIKEMATFEGAGVSRQDE
jgi:nicotinate-nucleotide--dimethylbenzimidazole phosphoribosyltransferase